jgi:hypothetical protein
MMQTGSVPHVRFQLYFQNREPLTDAKDVEDANRTLRDLFGGDDVQNCDRIMRIGGTINYPPKDKQARGYAVELTKVQVVRDAPTYGVEALCALAPVSEHDPFAEYARQVGTQGRDDDELLALLKASQVKGQWHNSMRAATASMVGKGWPKLAIRATCAPYAKGGVDDADVERLIDGAIAKYANAEAGRERAPKATVAQPKPPLIIATPYVWTDPEQIPRREFLYGHRLIRDYVSATIAPGGVGKTAKEVAEALSMVSGKALLGVPSQQLRVWLWSLEDPREEMARRIQATAKYYGLTPDDIGDRLFLDSGREQSLVIAEAVRNGFVIHRPVIDAIIAQLKERQIDVLIIDPFVSCHRVTENDNNAIDAATKAWASVAHAANCGVELVHHVRKGEQEITTESARGGGSFGDACRMVRVINRMTKDEAARAGVENHRLYFRTYLDKNNLAPPADKSDWFKLVPVDLGNGPMGPNVVGGDAIGVVTNWYWPDATQDLTGRDFEAAAFAIQAGNWRADPQAKDWVGRAVAKALSFDLDDRADRARVVQITKFWITTGALVEVDGLTEKREKKKFVRVAEPVGL